jgi:nucleotide-binding universal stress UspA family protein
MFDILITTNGNKETWHAIKYGAWFAETMQLKITLLGVTERLSPAAIDDHHPLEDVFERAIRLFKEKGVAYSLEVQNGDVEEVISQRANRGEFITVVSPLGRSQIRRWLVGRSIRHFMATIANPILYVPEARLPLSKLLICVGGLGYEVNAEALALQIAMSSQAEVTLLHIVPPVNLDYPTARDASEHWRDLINTDTMLGRNLRKAVETVQAAGLTARVEVRQGHVVEEIVSAMKAANYDLVCMGSPFGGNALRQLYAPNVTAEIAESSRCPVLTARHKFVQFAHPGAEPQK